MPSTPPSIWQSLGVLVANSNGSLHQAAMVKEQGQRYRGSPGLYPGALESKLIRWWIANLHLSDQQQRILNVLLDPLQETSSRSAIVQAVIEYQAEG